MNIEFVNSRYILYCGAPFEGAPQYISYTLDAFLHSPRLSVGSELCFLRLRLPKFFYAIIDFSCSCFPWYGRDANFSHMYTELKTAFVM